MNFILLIPLELRGPSTHTFYNFRSETNYPEDICQRVFENGFSGSGSDLVG